MKPAEIAVGPAVRRARCFAFRTSKEGGDEVWIARRFDLQPEV
jgi:hypothetical protein